MSQSMLNDKIGTALSESPYLAGRTLRFETEEGCVTLHGEVRSFFQKQMAQETLRDVEGIREIRNELSVRTPHSRRTSVSF